MNTNYSTVRYTPPTDLYKMKSEDVQTSKWESDKFGNIAHFIGHLKDGKPQFGVLTITDKYNTISRKYEGYFEDRRPHGLGQLTINNEIVFVGFFVNGLPINGKVTSLVAELTL